MSLSFPLTANGNEAIKFFLFELKMPNAKWKRDKFRSRLQLMSPEIFQTHPLPNFFLRILILCK